jgi:hypothetical protein
MYIIFAERKVEGKKEERKEGRKKRRKEGRKERQEGGREGERKGRRGKGKEQEGKQEKGGRECKVTHLWIQNLTNIFWVYILSPRPAVKLCEAPSLRASLTMNLKIPLLFPLHRNSSWLLLWG